MDLKSQGEGGSGLTTDDPASSLKGREVNVFEGGLVLTTADRRPSHRSPATRASAGGGAGYASSH